MFSPARSLVAAGVIALAGGAVVPTTLAASAAAGPRRYAVPCAGADATSWTYAAKPKTCGAYDQASDPAATVVLTNTKLKWKSWGAKTATGSGHLTTPTYDDAVTIKASGLKRCSAALSIYTKIQVLAPAVQNAKLATESKIPCPTP